MTETFHPNAIPLTASGSLGLTRTLHAIKEQPFSVPLADETIIMPAKWLMVNLFLWRPLARRGMPIGTRHTLRDGLLTSARIAAQQTEIYNDVIQAQIATRGETDPAAVKAILEDLCETINDLHTMIVTQLGEYHLSISAFELCDLLECPEIKTLTDVDVSRELTIGIAATEARLKEAGDALMARLADPTLPGNVLARFIALGSLSNKQLPQLLVSFGHRKDASDSVVRYPVLTSGVKGMRNILDYAVMSLDAKLTAFYNKDAMPRSQYNSRKQQILSTAVYRLHPGDCGSTVTVPFLITGENARNVVGKNIVIAGTGGRLARLTDAAVKEHVGAVVHLRSPITCRHTDGTCHACGGLLTEFMPPQTVIGIASTIEYMGKVAQLVLSVKHFATTRALTYPIPEHFRDLLEVRNNDIYLRRGVATDRLKIGVQFRDIPLIRQLQAPEDAETVAFREQQFSSIYYAQFADADTGVPQTPEVGLVADGTVPYFSAEFLAHIRDRFSTVTITDDWVWIPLKRFDHENEPLFRCVVQSSSMRKFNDDLAKFATSEIGRYTSVEHALHDFANKVYQEVNPNLFHLECVIKSYLVTSETDYRVPVVTDINKVKFGTLLGIIPRRSLGGMFAYERLAAHLTDPAMFIFPHQHGFFDPFFYSDARPPRATVPMIGGMGGSPA